MTDSVHRDLARRVLFECDGDFRRALRKLREGMETNPLHYRAAILELNTLEREMTDGE